MAVVTESLLIDKRALRVAVFALIEHDLPFRVASCGRDQWRLWCVSYGIGVAMEAIALYGTLGIIDGQPFPIIPFPISVPSPTEGAS